MTAQEATVILGKLSALEYLYSTELAERFNKAADPIAVVNAYEELLLSSLNLKAVMSGNSKTAIHNETVASVKSLFSDVKQHIRGD